MPRSSIALAAQAATVITLCTHSALAALDEPTPQPNGVFQRVHRCHALTGADIIIRPGERLEDATIVIRDGIIEAIGTDITIPPDARLWPCDDLLIHAGLVEPAKLIDVSHEPDDAGTHWNANIHPQIDLEQDHSISLSAGDASALRKAGYCVVAMHPGNGILRGKGMVTTTANVPRQRRTYDANMPHSAGFDRGGWGGKGPGSLMGAIALARQTLMDARWHAAANAAAKRAALEAPARRDDLVALEAASLGMHPLLFETDSVKDAMRAGALARELGLDIWVLGSGTEYQDLDGVRSLNAPFIVPVNFPDRPKLDTIDAAQRVPLRTLQAWEQAPTNLRRLHEAGIDICVTARGLSKPEKVHEALRNAMHAGLDSDAALALVTIKPAQRLGIDDVCGTLEPGKAAHLVLCTGEPFAKGTKIKETWVSGWRNAHDTDPLASLKGNGHLVIGDTQVDASIDTTKKKLTVKLPDDTSVKAKAFDLTAHRLSAAIDGRLLGMTNWVRLAGVIRDDQLIGRAVLPDGTTVPMSFTLVDDDDSEEDESDEDVEVASAETEAEPTDPVAGTWHGSLDIPDADFAPPFLLVIERDGDTITGTLEVMEQHFQIEGSWDEATRVLAFSREIQPGMTAGFTLTIDGNTMTGTATGPMGEVPASASRDAEEPTTANAAETDDDDEGTDVRWTGIPQDVPFPLGARGRLAPPPEEHVVIEHATLWTCGPDGLIEDGCLIVRDGKLAFVGATRNAPRSGGARVIDATGLHISPGLIDCHSHTGIDGGVNEFSSACTADVSIGDVVSGDDMSWYRQLAGGLTAANQLHGSANPIGGRNSVVKLRWGRHARDFPVDDAPPGIKFALGENVKRSSGRYPDTRMGVEAFIRDKFAAAAHYRATWDAWDTLSDSEQLMVMPPRWDARLETLAQIIDGERLIHCHSYRQDEILALLRTCEDYGIRIGTLQHILEGYKVADAIADHGAGASSFSDWWAYKVEVMDAIPWNGSIMHDVGVVVSFNSDDSELATRMNDEAAKAVRYGGVDAMEALKFVCLNPAKQLGIDHRTGSLETGKDADFAIWSHSPLNSYALCRQTWIDGTPYFTREDDAALARRDGDDRRRLVELVLSQSLGDPPDLPQDDLPQGEGAETATPAWAIVRNPYAAVDDHRGCCGVGDESHTHEETH
jgi:N-acetylglucosamine-6-phosphate deacetylase